MGWPKEYGGQGKSAIEQFIFYDETMRVGSPAPMLTINTVGPTIMEYGTDEQKDFFLPQIAAGKTSFLYRLQRTRCWNRSRLINNKSSS